MDVLEFIDLSLDRSECMHIDTKCASPESRAWVGAIVAANLAVSTIILYKSIHVCMSRRGGWGLLVLQLSFFDYFRCCWQLNAANEMRIAVKSGDVATLQTCLVQGVDLEWQDSVRFEATDVSNTCVKMSAYFWLMTANVYHAYCVELLMCLFYVVQSLVIAFLVVLPRFSLCSMAGWRHSPDLRFLF